MELIGISVALLVALFWHYGLTIKLYQENKEVLKTHYSFTKDKDKKND